jgi:opacity protein-like surface antigen
MRTLMLVGVIGVLVTVGTSSADAQTRTRRVVVSRVPAEDMWAAGFSTGAAGPSDPSLEKGFELVGTLERYLTPRVSIRGQLGGSSWGITGRNFGGTVSPFFVDGNVVYNWEGGALHPFVTGGVGLYRFHASETATQDRTDTKPGVNVGGGLEYFLNRLTTVTTELDYHKIGDVNTPLATFNDGSFWRFGVGLKRYW